MGKLKKQFGKRVQALRFQEKMTQEDLANAVGITIESISNIERGIYGPTFDTLEKLANALGEEVKNLFVFDES
jgi:transcriptional regulator with XRE-family HTH domain